MKKYLCPKCGGKLDETETEGLWCSKGCYKSEYGLWKDLQK